MFRYNIFYKIKLVTYSLMVTLTNIKLVCSDTVV